MKKICEFCGKEFEVPNNCHGSKRRFCNTSCSAKWRVKTFGMPKISEQGKQHKRESLQKLWRTKEFREQNYIRMTTNNPVYQKGVVEKATATRLKNGSYKNNFKYGNGKITPQEQKAKDYLNKFNFYYNYAIPTKTIRHMYPEKHYSVNYKPDFVNLEHKVCVEIDGHNHQKETYKQIYDNKKEECLRLLGYKIFRFTNEQVDNGDFFREVTHIWQDW
jgi:hypothetical protein